MPLTWVFWGDTLHSDYTGVSMLGMMTQPSLLLALSVVIQSFHFIIGRDASVRLSVETVPYCGAAVNGFVHVSVRR